MRAIEPPTVGVRAEGGVAGGGELVDRDAARSGSRPGCGEAQVG